MQVKARLRNVSVSAQKARLVADLIRGKTVDNAIDVLTYSNKKSADLIKGLLMSAVYNAENNFGLDIDSLFVDKIHVDQGRMIKKSMARAKGRSNRIQKKTSHISVELAEKESK
jgi:large subunit ribosomal protein L22